MTDNGPHTMTFPAPVPEPVPPKKAKVWPWVLGGFFVLMVIGALVPDTDPAYASGATFGPEHIEYLEWGEEGMGVMTGSADTMTQALTLYMEGYLSKADTLNIIQNERDTIAELNREADRRYVPSEFRMLHRHLDDAYAHFYKGLEHAYNCVNTDDSLYCEETMMSLERSNTSLERAIDEMERLARTIQYP